MTYEPALLNPNNVTCGDDIYRLDASERASIVVGRSAKSVFGQAWLVSILGVWSPTGQTYFLQGTISFIFTQDTALVRGMKPWKRQRWAFNSDPDSTQARCMALREIEIVCKENEPAVDGYFFVLET